MCVCMSVCLSVFVSVAVSESVSVCLCVFVCVCLVLPKTRSADTGRTRTLLYRYWQPPINNQRTMLVFCYKTVKVAL